MVIKPFKEHEIHHAIPHVFFSCDLLVVNAGDERERNKKMDINCTYQQLLLFSSSPSSFYVYIF